MALLSKLKHASHRDRAIIYMFIATFLLIAVSYFWNAHNTYVIQRGIQQGEARGALIEKRICHAFHELGSLKPPAGNPANNPSRAYLQNQHTKLILLGRSAGCRP